MTGDRDPVTGAFLKGKKGGPGRPKGNRNRLGEAFLADMQAAWVESGASVIKKVIETRPQDFLKIVASLMPQELHVKTGPVEELTGAELTDNLDKLAELIALARGASDVAKATHGGAGSA